MFATASFVSILWGLVVATSHALWAWVSWRRTGRAAVGRRRTGCTKLRELEMEPDGTVVWKAIRRSASPGDSAVRQTRLNPLTRFDDQQWERGSTGNATQPEFCRAVKRRLAEWKRGGARLSVILVSVLQPERSAIDRRPNEDGSLPQVILTAATAALRDMDLLAELENGCLGILVPTANSVDAATIASRVCHAIRTCAASTHSECECFSAAAGFTEATEGDDMVRLLTRAEESLRIAVQDE